MSRTIESTHPALTAVEIRVGGVGEIDVIAVPLMTTATVTLTAIGAADHDTETTISAAAVTDGPRLVVDVPAPKGGSTTVGGITITGGGTVIVGDNMTFSTIVGGRGSGPMKISGSGVSVRSGGGGVRAVVRVPIGMAVRARTQAGSIVTTGPLAEVDAETGSGRITISTADTVIAETGSGDVVIQVATTLDARTGSGDVVIRQLSGHARVSTGSGDIVAHVVNGGQLRGRTGSGDIIMTADPGVLVDRAQLRTSSGDIHTP